MEYSKRKEKTMEFLRKFWVEEEGQDMAEYALLLVLVALVAIVAITVLGSNVNKVFSNAAACLAPS
jgi:pilus assembly protein Flp/PilA